MKMDVRFDVNQAKAMLSGLQKQVLPLATSHAINKTIQAAKSAAVKLIVKDIGIKQKDGRSSITLLRATRIKLQAIVQAKGQRLPIIKLDPHAIQNNVGFIYKGQDGKLKQIAGALIAAMETGH
jgi:CheY-like chemotaxis protein